MEPRRRAVVEGQGPGERGGRLHPQEIGGTLTVPTFRLRKESSGYNGFDRSAHSAGPRTKVPVNRLKAVNGSGFGGLAARPETQSRETVQVWGSCGALWV